MKTKILTAMLFTALIFILVLGGCKKKNGGTEYHTDSSEYAALESGVVDGNDKTDDGDTDNGVLSSNTVTDKDENKNTASGDTVSNKTETPVSGEKQNGNDGGSSSSGDKIPSSSDKNETSSATSSSKDSGSSAVSSNDVTQGGSGDIQIGSRPDGVPDIWA